MEKNAETLLRYAPATRTRVYLPLFAIFLLKNPLRPVLSTGYRYTCRNIEQY